MSGWKKNLTHLAAHAERDIDELRYRLHYSLGGPGSIKIIPYRGYGRPDSLYIKGRVIEDKHIVDANENDQLWNNLVSMYKRLESDEVPGARILARFQGQEIEVTADEEGFFEVWIKPGSPLNLDQLWHTVDLELLSPRSNRQAERVKANAEILVPPASARFVVISDIDDTVIQTDATHLLRMARNVFLGNARTRLPFPGVAALYRALYEGPTGSDHNPMLYVSSSPWNLYDLLSQFFNLNNIPIGPILFLRDWGLTEEEIFPLKHVAYKTDTIRQMLDFYPKLPFILIGDSGQEDPEIYAKIAEEYPQRILAVYIRNVSRNLKRPEMIKELAEKVIDAGSALVLADDSVGIAKHALERNFISSASIDFIRQDKKKDKAPPSPLEKVVNQQEKPEPPVVNVVTGKDKPVSKVPPRPHETMKAVEEGAIEETIQKEGREETSRPPTVVVDTQEAKEKAEREAKPGKATKK